MMSLYCCANFDLPPALFIFIENAEHDVVDMARISMVESFMTMVVDLQSKIGENEIICMPTHK